MAVRETKSGLDESDDSTTLNSSGQTAVEVKNLWVRRAGKFILKDISFQVPTGKFVGIVGPNGAGKTTLLRAIVGERPTLGQVLIYGEDLYRAPEFWLRRIGYIPVDNILHEQLTISQALRFIGQLRLPDESLGSIQDKVDTLLTEFDFPPNDRRRQRQIKYLSTGERKRINICAELLTDPAILLLDEPTSNLDPDAERSLMARLRDRSHQNHQTVLLVTHTLNTIGECDQVLFIENSTLRADGEPHTILAQLERNDRKNVTESDFYRWAEVFDRYKTDEEKREHEELILPSHSPPRSAKTHFAPPVSMRHQFATLLRRYFQTRFNEGRVLAITLALGIIGGFFLFVLPVNSFLRPENPSEFDTKIVAAREAVFILALIVVLIGLIAAFREISKEFRIYQHERLKGLSPLAYVLSKWFWLAVAVGMLAPAELLFMLALQGQRLPSIPLDPLTVGALGSLTLILTCIAALTLGLAISAAAGNDNVATVLLALVVVFHILLSGLLRNNLLENVISSLSVLATSRWGVEGFTSSLSLYCWATVKTFSDFNSYGHLLSIWLALIAYLLVGIGVSVGALYLRDPWLTWHGLAESIGARRSIVLVFLCALIFLASWSLFLRDHSLNYYQLTFADRFYGGIRFARIEYAPEATPLQFLDGYINQTQCGAPDE